MVEVDSVEAEEIRVNADSPEEEEGEARGDSLPVPGEDVNTPEVAEVKQTPQEAHPEVKATHAEHVVVVSISVALQGGHAEVKRVPLELQHEAEVKVKEEVVVGVEISSSSLTMVLEHLAITMVLRREDKLLEVEVGPNGRAEEDEGSEEGEAKITNRVGHYTCLPVFMYTSCLFDCK